ncbi:hypothetical protein [Thalassobellus citreus]|uniref:hypothetical protein n=1 Tax=Thalassobellus citreus TaxID=3367752 RepID=UPI0037AA84FD
MRKTIEATAVVQNTTHIVEQFVNTNKLPQVINALKTAKHKYVAKFKSEIEAELDMQERLNGKRQLILNLIEFNHVINFLDVLNRYPNDVFYFSSKFTQLNFVEMYDVISDASIWFSSKHIDNVIILISAIQKQLSPELDVSDSLTLKA